MPREGKGRRLQAPLLTTKQRLRVLVATLLSRRLPKRPVLADGGAAPVTVRAESGQNSAAPVAPRAAPGVPGVSRELPVSAQRFSRDDLGAGSLLVGNFAGVRLGACKLARVQPANTVTTAIARGPWSASSVGSTRPKHQRCRARPVGGQVRRPASTSGLRGSVLRGLMASASSRGEARAGSLLRSVS